MATASISPEPDASGRVNGVARFLSARPLISALVVLASIVVARAFGSVDADVAWQLWIGRQLNHGARLYANIVETNPPLWFWMAAPVDRLSDMLAVRSDHLLVLLIGAAAGLSIAAIDRLLGSMGAPLRSLVLGYAALLLVAMPWLEFGQREHIALIGSLPYAALLAARRAGRPVSARLAAAIGIGAALGFALKHYFLIVPLLLELWLVATLGRKRRPLRAGTVAAGIVGLIYAVALLLAAHDYLTTVVPLLLLAYGATGAKHFVDLFQPAVLTALLSMALMLSDRRLLRSNASAIPAAFSVATIGFTTAYFIQAKGWSYHALPMLGCSAMALGAALAVRPSTSPITIVAAPALLVLPFAIAAQQGLGQFETDRDVVHAVEGMRPGAAVGFISPDPSFGWHIIPQRAFRFALRYNGFWMMQAVVTNELRGGTNPRLTLLGRRVVRQTVQDFRCTPPQRIVFKRPTPAGLRAGEFDILAFFLRDPEFASLLSHYRPIERTSVEVFELTSPYRRARNCPGWSPV